MMARFPRPLAFAGGLTLALAGLAVPVSAALPVRTMRLHGSMYARQAMATVVVTQTSPDDYRVKVTAAHLPDAAMLRVSPRRHVYIAWAADGMGQMPMVAAIPLKANAAGVYSGTRVVMMKHVARVFVTAEGSAMARHPSMPEVTVLDSAMMHG